MVTREHAYNWNHIIAAWRRGSDSAIKAWPRKMRMRYVTERIRKNIFLYYKSGAPRDIHQHWQSCLVMFPRADCRDIIFMWRRHLNLHICKAPRSNSLHVQHMIQDSNNNLVTISMLLIWQIGKALCNRVTVSIIMTTPEYFHLKDNDIK